jgi:phospholipase/lecithinase/hemolysin
MKRQTGFVVSLAAACLVALSFPNASAVPLRVYDSFYVFGDSLADIGNVLITSQRLSIDPAPPPSTSPHRTYYRGRFSNGPVAFEYLWQLVSGSRPESSGGLKPFMAAPILAPRGAVNFAFGGTGTRYISQTPGGLYAPGLKGQVELFRAALQRRAPSKGALYAIVTGSNDYRDDQFNEPMSPPDVVGNIVDAVETLYRVGARDVMVLNMPDLGLLPGAGGPGSPESELSAVHNLLLANALATLAAQRPSLRLTHVDINQAFALLPPGMDLSTPALDVMFPPETLPPGFRMSLCLFIDPATCVDVPTFNTNSAFLFWDVVHPTTDGHRVLGQYLYDELQR